MVGLPDGKNFLNIRLFVSTPYTNVTDGQTDGQTPHDGAGGAYAKHRATKTFLALYHLTSSSAAADWHFKT